MKKETPDWFIRADTVIMRVYKVFSYLACLALIAIMLVAFINVICEKLGKINTFFHGINSYADWIAYLHVVIVFASCGFVTIERGHTCVDILTNRFSQTVQRIAAGLGALLGAAVGALLTWRGFLLVQEMVKYNKKISTSSWSFVAWPFGVVFLIGCFFLTFSFIWLLLRIIFRYSLKNEKENAEENETVPEEVSAEGGRDI